MVTNVRVTNVLVTKRWSQTSRSETSGSQTSWSQTSAHHFNYITSPKVRQIMYTFSCIKALKAGFTKYLSFYIWLGAPCSELRPPLCAQSVYNCHYMRFLWTFCAHKRCLTVDSPNKKILTVDVVGSHITKCVWWTLPLSSYHASKVHGGLKGVVYAQLNMKDSLCLSEFKQ